MKQPIMRMGYSLALGLGLALTVLWLAGGYLPAAGAAGPWYVSTTGSDGNNCSDVLTPCLTIGGAVGKATTGDLIHIAAGTYTENVSITGKALTLIGAGAGNTIVDGSGTGRVFDTDADLTLSSLTIQNGNSASSDGGGLHATSAVTLTSVSVLSSTAFFSGGGAFVTGPAVFSNSLFQGNASLDGGGAYISNTLTLTNTQFISNTASTWGGGARALLAANLTGGQFQRNSADSGGGLYVDAALTLADTQFVSNTAASFGGGAYLNDAGALASAGFAGNMASTGGGAFFNGPAVVTGTTLFSNTAGNVGGGAYFNAGAALTNTVFTQNLGNSSSAGGGGATFVVNATVSGGAFVSNTTHFAGGGAYFGAGVTIADTAFTNNVATTNRGGGAYFNGPAALIGATFTSNQTPADRGAGAYFRDSATISGTDFVDNLAGSRGAGAYFFASTALTRTRFFSNTAGVHGGGAYFNAAFQLLDSRFISNTAQTGNGGGAFQAGAGNGSIVNGLFTGNQAGVAGADVYLGTSGANTLLNTTLANSTVNAGAAVFVGAGSVAVTNTLFANYAAGLIITGGVTASSDFNLFYNAPTNVITGSHSLSATNPLFVNPAAGNYHLGTGSPAEGAGVNAGILTDLDGLARRDPPSIGAYELPAYALTVTKTGSGQGSVTQVPSQTVYVQGTVVTLTASANGGSTFAGWSGAVSGPANPISVIMNSAKSLTATFNLIPPTADLLIGLLGTPSQVPPGALVSYTLVVTNTGPVLATTVRLTDTLSANSTFQSLASPAGWSCQLPSVGSSGTVICTASSLTAGAPATFTLSVYLSGALPAAALVSNTATVTSAQFDPTLPNAATATTEIFAYRFYAPFMHR